MAFYSFGRIKICSRTKTKSAVATAAYHSGTKITNEYDGSTFDFSRKKDVGETIILMPEGVPSTWTDENVPAKERVAVIWNDVEKAHPNSNAQLCRYNHIAFDNSLSYEDNMDCVRQFVKENCTDKGMGVVLNFHNVPGNPHVDAMYLMTEYDNTGKAKTRQEKQYFCRAIDGSSETYLNAEEFKLSYRFEKVYKYKNENGDVKQMTPSESEKEAGWTRVNKHPVSRTVRKSGWDNPDLAKQWRKSWEVILNAKLEERGFSERVDCRSYEEQGSDRIATVHEGYGAGAEIRKQRNKEIKAYNKMIDEIKTTATECTLDLNKQLRELNKKEEISKDELTRERNRFLFNKRRLHLIADSGLINKNMAEDIKTHLKALESLINTVLKQLRDKIKGDTPKKIKEAEDTVKTIEKTVEMSIDDIIGSAAARSEEHNSTLVYDKTKDDGNPDSDSWCEK